MTLKSAIQFLRPRLRALVSWDAWFLIVLGLGLFTLRTPMPSVDWINLPVAATAFQTAGLMFMLAGFQVMLSMLVWPNIKFRQLLESAERGNIAAGITVAGLLVFNGIALFASVMWLSYAVGAQVGR